MEKKSSAPANRVPNLFIEKHQKDVMGILHCFDRLRLQGSLRYLYCTKIFEEYLSQAKVLCKDFKKFATGLTDEVCERAERLAQSLKRPFTYLSSSALSKEDLARKIAERDGIKEGLDLYFYIQHPRLGLMHLRLQTWFLRKDCVTERPITALPGWKISIRPKTWPIDSCVPTG
jgi:hypothetical protein